MFNLGKIAKLYEDKIFDYEIRIHLSLMTLKCTFTSILELFTVKMSEKLILRLINLEKALQLFFSATRALSIGSTHTTLLSFR